jgi:hypothetical protein
VIAFEKLDSAVWCYKIFDFGRSVFILNEDENEDPFQASFFLPFKEIFFILPKTLLIRTNLHKNKPYWGAYGYFI